MAIFFFVILTSCPTDYTNQCFAQQSNKWVIASKVVRRPLTISVLFAGRMSNEGTDFIFPCFSAGDRMIFAEKTRKKFSPLTNVEKFNLSPGLS